MVGGCCVSGDICVHVVVSNSIRKDMFPCFPGDTCCHRHPIMTKTGFGIAAVLLVVAVVLLCVKGKSEFAAAVGFFGWFYWSIFALVFMSPPKEAASDKLDQVEDPEKPKSNGA